MHIAAICHDLHQSNLRNGRWFEARELLADFTIVDVISGYSLIDDIQNMAEHSQQILDSANVWWSSMSMRLTMCWNPYDMRGFDKTLANDGFRGDEITFKTLAVDEQISWVTGHPRAILSWAASLHGTEAIADPWPTSNRFPDMSSTAKLVWWAQRINLRVYGVQ